VGQSVLFVGFKSGHLPDLSGAVVIYGFGPEVASLMSELDSRDIPTVVIEEDEIVARRLHARGEKVVHASLAEGDLDLQPLTEACALGSPMVSMNTTPCSR